MPLPIEIIAPLAISLLLIVCCLLLTLALVAAYDEEARNPTPRRRKRRKTGQRSFNELDNLGVPIEILALTHNRETAYRLYEDVKWRYSAQSAQWIWDKVKWDIIRDRH